MAILKAGTTVGGNNVLTTASIIPISSLSDGVALSSSEGGGINLNTLTESGMYRVDSSLTNSPNGLEWGQLLVMHGGGDTICQIYSSYATGELYVRSGNPTDVGGNGTWTTWKKVWTDGNDGTGSGLDADLLDGLNSDSFMRRDTNDFFYGKLSVGSTLNRSAGMYGVYDSTKIGHIWSMGTGYSIPDDGSNFGTLYGLAYKHTNNATGGTMAGGHQMVWCSAGTGKSAMGDNIWTSGNVTAYSDRRVKTNIQKIDNALDKVGKLNGYTFDRTDVDLPRQTGVIAQEVLEVLPEAITGDEEGMYSVAYGNMVGLLIEAIKEQQQQIEELKAEVVRLGS